MLAAVGDCLGSSSETEAMPLATAVMQAMIKSDRVQIRD
jgi:hypothetical protein